MSALHPPGDWPAVEYSQFADGGSIRWHYQRRGRGVRVLLIHGTGASSHSWVPAAAHLEDSAEILAPDLPGHGFTSLGPASCSSLPGMARALAELLRSVDFSPEVIVGHSAGAAVAATLCLQGACNPRVLVSVNGALLPFGRAAAPVFSRAARLLASLPVFPQLVALHAVPRKPVERMLRQTGSTPPPAMIRSYRELLGSTRHVAGTLRMMANWELGPLEENLDRLEPELYLLVAEDDQVVSPRQGAQIHDRLPSAHLIRQADLGHLAHEEDPAWFAATLRRITA